MPAASARNSSESSNNRSGAGRASTNPREALSTYDVMATLAPSAKGPSVIAAQ